MAIKKGPRYGPPYYDISKKANMAVRKKRQAETGKPSPMYSSDWYGFRRGVLRDNPYIEKELYKLALKSSFALKRHIPLGDDGRDGHLRNAVRVQRVLRGGMFEDRTVYHVHGAGGGSKAELGKWHGATYRATFHNAEAYKRRRLGEVGEIPSWLKKAERDVSNG